MGNRKCYFSRGLEQISGRLLSLELLCGFQ